MDLSDLTEAVRRHVRVVVAALVVAALVAGLYVFTRRETSAPDKFRATANVQIPARQPADRNSPQPAVIAPPGMPQELLREQVAMALSPEVRQKALSDSGAPANDTSVSFSAEINSVGDTVTLTVTGGDSELITKVIGNYAQAFVGARRDLSALSIQARVRGAQEEVQALRERRSAVEAQLRQRLNPLPPVVTPASGTTESSSTGGGTGGSDADASSQLIPIIPPEADADTVLLLFERNAIANRIIQAQLAYADAAVNSSTPNAYAEVLDQSGAARIAGDTSSPLVPVGIIILSGLALGIGAAIVLDRRDHTIKSAKLASATLSAPLLSTVPPHRRGKAEYAVLERPDSDRSDAFLTLAATCVATDRLPSAIMVSTPDGDTCDDVAANLAAALASLGLRVALVATSPRQSWYLDQFTLPADVGADVAQLLEEAHEGRFNGEATRRLAWTDLTPNLVVVPPAPEAALSVPLDGLPPFLETLAKSGIDVTVIAGPPLLENANATIVAWATRSVLWAMQVGKVTRRAASEAAARLELASVDPFGVVMVGAPED